MSPPLPPIRPIPLHGNTSRLRVSVPRAAVFDAACNRGTQRNGLRPLNDDVLKFMTAVKLL